MHCNSNNVAGVECEGKLIFCVTLFSDISLELCTDFSVRFIGTTYPNMGRVELCLEKTWHTVCLVLPQVASTICTQLGYSPYGTYNDNTISYFILYKGVVVIKESFIAPVLPQYRGYIECEEGMTSLSQCTFLDVGKLQRCDNNRDTGVICQSSNCVLTS